LNRRSKVSLSGGERVFSLFTKRPRQVNDGI